MLILYLEKIKVDIANGEYFYPHYEYEYLKRIGKDQWPPLTCFDLPIIYLYMNTFSHIVQVRLRWFGAYLVNIKVTNLPSYP